MPPSAVDLPAGHILRKSGQQLFLVSDFKLSEVDVELGAELRLHHGVRPLRPQGHSRLCISDSGTECGGQYVADVTENGDTFQIFAEHWNAGHRSLLAPGKLERRLDGPCPATIAKSQRLPG